MAQNPTDPEARRRHRIIAAWLLVMCAMVFVMVVLGGVTRLTHSGLSMVEWKPVSGWLPPHTEAAWHEVFEKYRQTPEFREVNKDMTLSGFKGIFWLEFVHRVWGRLLGVAFLVPFIFFVARGWARGPMVGKLAVMFVLGGLQGVLGWYMVKSGLVDRPDVSQYRLTAHLGAALVIHAYMFWVALGLLLPAAPQAGPSTGKPPAGGGLAAGLAVLVLVTALSGGFVAGLDAGLSYNTFPLMSGQLIPDGLFAMDPPWVNFFENITTVQFDHRILAYAVAVMVALVWWRARNAGSPRIRRAVTGLVLAAVVQVGLGIATLLLMVPVSVAALHQAGAVVLFTVALWVAHAMRPGSAAAPAAAGVEGSPGWTRFLP
jgi:cytochrome c oxidase assembly protein subunit 15